MQLIEVKVSLAFYDDVELDRAAIEADMYGAISPDFHYVQALAIKIGPVLSNPYPDPTLSDDLDSDEDFEKIMTWVEAAKSKMGCKTALCRGPRIR